MESFHSVNEFLDEVIVEYRWSLLSQRVVMDSVDNWMQLEPNIQQVHKNILTIEMWGEQNISFTFPLFSEFLRNFLQKHAVPIELINFFSVLKQLKFWKIVCLTWLGPVHLISLFTSVWSYTISSSELFVHLWMT